MGLRKCARLWKPCWFYLAAVSQSDKSGDKKIGTVSLLHHSASYLMFQWSMVNEHTRKYFQITSHAFSVFPARFLAYFSLKRWPYWFFSIAVSNNNPFLLLFGTSCLRETSGSFPVRSQNGWRLCTCAWNVGRGQALDFLEQTRGYTNCFTSEWLFNSL